MLTIRQNDVNTKPTDGGSAYLLCVSNKIVRVRLIKSQVAKKENRIHLYKALEGSYN